MTVLDLVNELRSNELDSLRSEIEQGRKRHILKTLDERGRASELVRQQYSGRYAFELLQNANDAIASTAAAEGAVRFAVTDQALLVADQGSGFGPDEVRAICGLGRSSKDPRKSIGYKGLGFKSVGEITDRPQIISQQVRFGFDEQRAREAVEDVVGDLAPRQRVPVYAFPFELEPRDLGDDEGMLDALVSDGATSILRLPFRDNVARETVTHQVRQSVTARLLLFLDATTQLSVVGGEDDFDAEIIREHRDPHTEVLLETEGLTEHWLVYPRLLPIPAADLVEPLGDAWATVEQVRLAAAVRLDDTGRPASDRNEPLHVYFPTDEHSGFPLVLHADFALDLDRRRISQTPEAQRYNEWLARELAGFVGDVVAPHLGARDRGDGLSLAAVAPTGPPAGYGADVQAACLAALANSRFVPAADGSVRHPAEVMLLPASVPDAVTAHRFLDVADLAGLVPPQAQNHRPIRTLLCDSLDAAELNLNEALGRLVEPDPEDDPTFFTFFVEWAESAGRHRFAISLEDVFCVRTAAGRWARPSSGLFFPRRDDTAFPQVLHVPIADVPEVDGLRELLRDAGVRDFEWRELLTGFVLPLITAHDTDAQRREAAMVALRTYYTTALREEGAQAVRDQAAGVLLPAARADGSDRARRPARELYFPSRWTGNDRLEGIYGPFGEADFLAVEPPQDGDLLEEETGFLHWLGVEDKPRLHVADPSSSTEYKVHNLQWHPHARNTAHWGEWLQREDVHAGKRCEHGHPQSQQLRGSATLDRLGRLIEGGDRARLGALWLELSASWPHYQPAMTATFRCLHSQHDGDRDRQVPSLLGHVLETAPWVPARNSESPVLEAPYRVWRPTRGTPRKVLARIPRIEPHLDAPDSMPMANRLGIIDAARPSVQHLVVLLAQLAAGHDDIDMPDGDARDAARWAMRTLNDVLQEPDSPPRITCPLLVRHQGRAMFDHDPYVVNDPLLEETFEPLVVVLDADRNLRALHRACGLRHLDEEVEPRPIAAAASDADHEHIRRHLEDAKPYLAAVAVDAQPSRAEDVYRALSRLELIVCDELTVTYELGEHRPQRPDAVAFIAERIEQAGRARRRIGTAYLELDPATNQPHWFAFGPQLATFLEIPGQGDAFGLLLAARRQDRNHYLAARRVPNADLELARLRLDTPPDDDGYDELLRTTVDMTTGWSDAFGPERGEEPPPLPSGDTEEPGDGLPPDGPGEEPPPLPPLDPDGIVLVDADGSASMTEQPATHHPGSSGGLGPANANDPATADRLNRSIGHRGEEAAVTAERRRVHSLGLHPDAVRWVSRRHTYAVYDIESVDERGNRIYIEVKATTDADPRTPFLISENELTWALSKREAAYIYRVTDAHTTTPRITRYRDPIGLLLDERAKLNLGQARMAFAGGAEVVAEDDDG